MSQLFRSSVLFVVVSALIRLPLKTFVDGIANLKRKGVCAKVKVQADLSLLTKWWKQFGKRMSAVHERLLAVQADNWHERYSPKVNVFCAVSRKKVYGPFFFEGDTVNGMNYPQMLQNWLFPQLQADSGDFIFQQDGAPPHWHNNVRQILNNTAPPLDRAHGTSRQCPLFLASKITRLDPIRLFLVGICEGKCV
ncbi:hypothetical protein J6590_039907 [Homalodisca vitripennis]|nr:hypothetical protein J6590_039907 [Homalodisca vitripennis]